MYTVSLKCGWYLPLWRTSVFLSIYWVYMYTCTASVLILYWTSVNIFYAYSKFPMWYWVFCSSDLRLWCELGLGKKSSMIFLYVILSLNSILKVKKLHTENLHSPINSHFLHYNWWSRWYIYLSMNPFNTKTCSV